MIIELCKLLDMKLLQMSVPSTRPFVDFIIYYRLK
jgi:hypothetical protein